MWHFLCMSLVYSSDTEAAIELCWWATDNLMAGWIWDRDNGRWDRGKEEEVTIEEKR